MRGGIAIVGMACRYPDANSPEELWENALSQRRSFRRMPAERLDLEDYFDSDPAAPDAIYSTQAALIDGYEFDRVRFRIGGETYRSTDPAHWLALDTASRALADAGFPDGAGLPSESTGVIVGNSLTGEISRANLMRLRWPYVRRVLASVLGRDGSLSEEDLAFLQEVESTYKQPFPPIGDESLAGGLANTIAGRICNYFDLKGGGYTTDGACASSLLAVAHGCSALEAGQVDAAIVGGVDLSLDPFELVGFAKTGALAAGEMRVFDAEPTGFVPGEGCGFAVLMRAEDAEAGKHRARAVLRGWGLSSDGSGGITRPELDGQLLALRRAYAGSDFGIDSVGYFEGHGTGTAVGDETELKALTQARQEASHSAPAAAIGSIKANIGHTKAAAGIAGLIKATMVLEHKLIPPTSGCRQPHPVLEDPDPALRVMRDGEAWPPDRPFRAAVSAMGFGGINAHVVLEAAGRPRDGRRVEPSPRTARLLASPQDAELFLLTAGDRAGLERLVRRLSAIAAGVSSSELGDLASELARRPVRNGPRAAVVASTPAGLARRLATLEGWLTRGEERRMDLARDVFLGGRSSAPRIGYLFPGQGSPSHSSGGLWRRRFSAVADLYRDRGPQSPEPQSPSPSADTAHTQPAITVASLSGLAVLERLGVEASVAVGHSLGELVGLHWAGAIGRDELVRLVRERGRAMAEIAGPRGTMATLGAEPDAVEALIDGAEVAIAAFNGPERTVISGTAAEVAALVARAGEAGITGSLLQVSHAFHSPMVAPACRPLEQILDGTRLRPLGRRLASTITGGILPADADLAELLVRQITVPVRFAEAVTAVRDEVDLWIEVGPGHALTSLAGVMVDTPVIALDSGGASVAGLLRAVGAAFAAGAEIDGEFLTAGRFTRSFDLDRERRFFVRNPCETGIPKRHGGEPPKADSRPEPDPAFAAAGKQSSPAAVDASGVSALEIVRDLVARTTELPASAIHDDHRLLGDLHMNSLAVGHLASEASRQLGLPPPAAPTDYAAATVEELARALEESVRVGGDDGPGALAGLPDGIDSWVRTFVPRRVERALPRVPAAREPGAWRILAPDGHPLKGRLENATPSPLPGNGVALCLPREPGESSIELLLEAARAVLEGRPDLFLLLQQGGGGVAFARTLHEESGRTPTCVVDLPFEHRCAVDWIVREAAAALDYSEAYYDDEGTRREARLKLLPPDSPTRSDPDGPMPDQSIPLGPGDVLLVSGGGKGIAAECALALAERTGVRLALLGRSDPATDPVLEANLARFGDRDLNFRYLPTDVTAAPEVRAAVREIESDMGPVAGILHGAGVNRPHLLGSLTATAFQDTLRPKLDGLKNLLEAVPASNLRLLVAFGSLLGRTGMRGEADYAVANEWLAHRVESWAAAHPKCRCVTLEWSVWSGVGMGERLGRVDGLLREGITPISPERGIAELLRLVSRPLPSPSLVVSGRFGLPPALPLEGPDLPLLRFLEEPRAYYPGVELVADSRLSVDSDPYLRDHEFHGQRLFPAAMGLEAMAQAAMALTGERATPIFEDVEFSRPITVSEPSEHVLRVAALASEPGTVDLVVRTSETGFQVDHFRARCRWEPRAAETAWPQRSAAAAALKADPLELSPDDALYGQILFQQGRFHRVRAYRRLQARECAADISPNGTAPWFGGYLPGRLLLGDAGIRDAAIHAIQACVPHATVLPLGVRRLTSAEAPADEPVLVMARQRERNGDRFTYDVEIWAATGAPVERWEGLELKVVEVVARQTPWPAPLLGPYVERRLEELVPGTAVAVALEICPDPFAGDRSDRVLSRLLNGSAVRRKRTDGKPEIAGEGSVSTSHAEDWTLALAGDGPLGCDLEIVGNGSTSRWGNVLGRRQLDLADAIAAETGEDPGRGATRVWTLRECLKKAGAMVDAPLSITRVTDDGWVLLRSGGLVVASMLARTAEAPGELALAIVLSEPRSSARRIS